MLRAAFSLAWKDILSNLRTPFFLVVTVAVPLVFSGLYSLVVQVSATNPIAIARYSQGPYSEIFISILQEMKSVDGPYFRILTTNPGEAFDLYEDGDVGGVIEIPPDFDEQIERGNHADTNLHVYNINSDATKNLQLRLDHAIYLYQQQANGMTVTVQETATFQHDMSIKTYLGTALLMFTVLFAAMANTGSLLAQEWEDRTAKMVILTPHGFGALIFGKWLGAFLLTCISMLLGLIILRVTLAFPVTQLGINSWLSLLTFFFYGAAIGAFLGVRFQQSLPIIPICVMIAIVHFFLSGYESYIRGLAHEGGLYWVWQLTSWFPLARLTDAIRFDVLGWQTDFNWPLLGATLVLAALLTTPAIMYLRNHLNFSQGQ